MNGRATIGTRRAGGALVLALLIAVVYSSGCSYFRNRAQDAAEMFDIGLTFSKKPHFSAYMNCPVIAPLGYGKVDGTYVGVGGGKVGVMDGFHQESSGTLVWGREEVSWEGFDPEDADTLSVQGVGILGLAENRDSEDPYEVACIHYLHLGWVGGTLNIHWLEIPDFFLGIFLLDPMGDDGEDGGFWFWSRDKKAVHAGGDVSVPAVGPPVPVM
jgi:hypothetical protein